MAKGIDYLTQGPGGAELLHGTFTGTDAAVEAEWAAIEDGGRFTTGVPVVKAILHNTAQVTSGVVLGGSGDDTYGSINTPQAKVQGKIQFVVHGSGAIDNAAFWGNVVHITTASGAFNISGIANGQDGDWMIILNTSGQNMTLTNNATSDTGNKIITNTGADVATTANGAALLVYSSANSCWNGGIILA